MSVKITAKMEGREAASKALKAYTKKLGGEPASIVGFGTTYALRVHETHPRKSKYLESASNEVKHNYTRELADRTRKLDESKHKNPLAAAIYQMALKVIRLAILRVPVDTGRLRSSHFVAPPEGVMPKGTPSTSRGR